MIKPKQYSELVAFGGTEQGQSSQRNSMLRLQVRIALPTFHCAGTFKQYWKLYGLKQWLESTREPQLINARGVASSPIRINLSLFHSFIAATNQSTD